MSAQSLDALEVANTVRVQAKHLRQEVTTRQTSFADALNDPRAGSMPIGRLLCDVPHWGPSKSHALLNRHHIWPTRRVRDLTDRQKRLLVEAVGC
jgi:hypothetical protein